MKQQKGAHIINVSSVAGHKVAPGMVILVASKHAVRALSEGLRQEVKPYNIHTTVISPGAVDRNWFTALPNQILPVYRSGRIDPSLQAVAPARASGATVTFETGARTAWLTMFSVRLCLSRRGRWAQRWGGVVEAIRPGDVIWFPPDEKHWHGPDRQQQ